MRKTKIIATVGPACESESQLRSLIRAGVDIFRINASHTTVPALEAWIRHINRVRTKEKPELAILVDLQGPRIRTGLLKNQASLYLRKGEKVYLVPCSKPGEGDIITTTCREIRSMVKKGDPILLDNGLLELKVTKMEKTRLVCTVMAGGRLGQNKGINLPNAPVTLPTLTPHDKRCLKVAAKMNADFIALSFVRSQKDILTVKNLLKRYKNDIPVIGKIEKPVAVKNIKRILEVTDALMVARGDLGIEMGIEKIPAVQKSLIEIANQHCVPIITATQMLESMIENINPTRAEASDIANAVFDSTDAVMLSGETAIGKHPTRAVKVMASIVAEAERHISEQPDLVPQALTQYKGSPIHAIARAARAASRNLGAKAIFAFTVSWKTARLVSKLGPRARIVALTPSKSTLRRLSLLWAVYPVQIRNSKNTDALIREVTQITIKKKLIKKGDPVVILSGKLVLSPSARYMVKIHYA